MAWRHDGKMQACCQEHEVQWSHLNYVHQVEFTGSEARLVTALPSWHTSTRKVLTFKDSTASPNGATNWGPMIPIFQSMGIFFIQTTINSSTTTTNRTEKTPDFDNYNIKKSQELLSEGIALQRWTLPGVKAIGKICSKRRHGWFPLFKNSPFRWTTDLKTSSMHVKAWFSFHSRTFRRHVSSITPSYI